MTDPQENDLQVISNTSMQKGEMFVSLDQVKDNVLKSNYPENKIHFIKMDVRNEKKLEEVVKSDIGILRLDTDFYDSTLSILNVLYSKVLKGGYIVHDDYGHWKGHYEACKKFYEDRIIKPAMVRTCRKEMVEIKY